MNKLEFFECEQETIRKLDFQGHALDSPEIWLQFQRRNSFGLAPETKIHRIFQKEFFEFDQANNYLTFPLAAATIWNDPLENPLSEIRDIDSLTGVPIHLGSLVDSFFALCWSNRSTPTESDWASFSHEKDAVRISTTVGKLMSRLMRSEDPDYMHRFWLIEVEYRDPDLIRAMQNPKEVYGRMEPNGALLAVSVALVRSDYSGEDEVRLLFDGKISPLPNGTIVLPGGNLVRIPFDWTDIIENIEFRPWLSG
ncbi:hypothetical protein FE236_00995 [Mariprofundus erugo]|uniref:hypothetical protein n=1 Tax=Mariprofundus erugo TaxID=2528639 RepID=UPI0010FEDB26|nr:hypothetical protein [Mariprofundus erugo]TLS78360.1 hypothetical protein FE236_00995 [Mariprofundus erugo]